MTELNSTYINPDTFNTLYKPMTPERQQDLDTGQMQNRLMAMQLQETGNSLAAQKSKENYLMEYDPNDPSTLRHPTNIGEYQAYQEIQATEQANTKGMTDLTMKEYMDGFFNNNPLKMSKALEIADSSPGVQNSLKQAGLYASMKRTKPVDPDSGLYNTDMILDEAALAKLRTRPNSGISPDTKPGAFHVEYVSPPGTSPLDAEKAELVSVKPFTPTKDQLADWQAWGDKAAATMLQSRAQELKAFSEPYTMKIGGKPVLVQRNAQTGEIKRLAEDKSTTVVVKPGGSGGESADDFRKWTKQDKEWWFETKKATGDKPDFGWGKAGAASRAQFAREYAQWAQGKGITGREAALGKEEYKADSGSLKFTTKQLDASKSFTKTIDNNIDQLERHITQMSKTLNLDRNRLLNMGTREFNTRLIGNANINIYDMLTQAISTENAKLQAGGAGSVAQVAEQARSEMKKIHDQNLPVSEMIKLMKATRQEGGNRIKGLEDTRTEIKKRMADQGQTDKQPEKSKGRDTSKARTYLEGANGKADAIGRIRALASKGWTKDELNELVKGTKWE